MTDPWAVSGVPVQVRRSARRRTVALQVRPGEITLYAPERVPLHTLREIVDARRAWIAHSLEEYAARAAATRVYADGSALPFLGETLEVRAVPGTRAPTRDGAALLVTPGSAAEVHAQVDRWTRAACAAPYRAEVERAAQRVGAAGSLGRVHVGSARYRWGSCTARGDIRVHWKLSRAPAGILEYVAVHEAAHLLEFNHSPRYWRVVERVLPDYRARRAWLRDHGHTL